MRVTAIADAAIEVVAAEGMRGLTHRAVDRAAGLPAGSTSYYARTRAALLELTIGRILELDDAEITVGTDRTAPALAKFLHVSLTKGRSRLIARYEFALEATRRPELRAIYDSAGRRFRDSCTRLLTDLGSPEPERHTRMLIAWCDGLLFDSVAGAGAARKPKLAELERGTHEFLRALLP
ncbi:TetR/AcrR family transcriptional regulator [Amycolatopsis endophytica]|uniref:DNA-binding transcriptional regulator YbjK n=1 Tax=Amycolatopsis endophytica TaxID=860233 RepID=A0A853AX82_9PSEU|nr:TetR family transcriptional regulator C-terminal domain-containing protein [Amycolatopsis endophytica]NYI87249.1 DNA-binding transcriptional regulator YbjK [Amycolatopsis endophytica]